MLKLKMVSSSTNERAILSQTTFAHPSAPSLSLLKFLRLSHLTGPGSRVRRRFGAQRAGSQESLRFVLGFGAVPENLVLCGGVCWSAHSLCAAAC